MPSETPNTLAYLVGGYVVFWLVTFVFVLSLVARTRNLEKDVEVLRSLLEEEQKDVEPGGLSVERKDLEGSLHAPHSTLNTGQ